MRAVVQRVSRAKVTVGDRVTGEIGQGLLVLLGAGAGDTEADLAYIVDKLVNLRIFADAAGKMNLSVKDISGGVLVVSQFTLYGDARQGRRPSFIGALEPTAAKALYERSLVALRSPGLIPLPQSPPLPPSPGSGEVGSIRSRRSIFDRPWRVTPSAFAAARRWPPAWASAARTNRRSNSSRAASNDDPVAGCAVARCAGRHEAPTRPRRGP